MDRAAAAARKMLVRRVVDGYPCNVWSPLAIAVFIVSVTSQAFASGPVGPEFQTADIVAAFRITGAASCTDTDGNQVVATWKSTDERAWNYLNLVVQRTDANGDEIDSFTANQEEIRGYEYSFGRGPPLAIDCEEFGSIAVTWADDGPSCWVTRTFSRDGEPLGDAVPVPSENLCGGAKATSLGSGRFAILRRQWVADDPERPAGYRLRVAAFDTAGNLVWPDRELSTPALSSNGGFAIGSDGHGSALIAWQADDGAREHVYTRLITPDGRIGISVHRMDQHPFAQLERSVPRVTGQGPERFVVFWSDSLQGGWMGRRFYSGDATTTTTTSTTTSTMLSEHAAAPLRFLDPLPVDRDDGASRIDSPPAVVARARGGDWFGTSSRRSGGAPGVYAYRSIDDGHIWSAPQRLGAGERSTIGIGTNDTIVVAGLETDRDDESCVVRTWRSDDYARTWSETARWDSSDYADKRDCGTLDLAGDSSGTWVLVWNAQDNFSFPTGDEDTVMVMTSQDDGRNWGGMTELHRRLLGWVEGVSVATDDQGHWIVAWIDDGLYASRSEDQGATWSPPRHLDLHARSVDLAVGHDGAFVLAAMSGSLAEKGTPSDADPVTYRLSRDSPDWEGPFAVAPYAENDHSDDSEPRLVSGADGRLLFAWQSYHALSGAAGTEAHIVTSFSEDGGMSWSAPFPLNPRANQDWSIDHLGFVAAGTADDYRIYWYEEDSSTRDYKSYLSRTLARDCGDGAVASGEICDDGNGIDGDGCDTNCTPTSCGNGVLTDGEGCDDANTWAQDACSPACEVSLCGDGDVNVGVEQCDDANSSNGDACVDGCELATCGDGYLHAGHEECDDGNLLDDDGCDSNCTAPRCGNGVTNDGEECDDGNSDENDDCLSSCRLNVCGDGFRKRAGVGYEECDDGNYDNGDGCDNNCTQTGCGNGVITEGEQCDDGGRHDDDDCLNNCTLGVCGDGTLRLRGFSPEECDDGNLVDGDGCDSNCATTRCGNGVRTDGEICDDGNQSDYDDCLTNCRPNVCGDGFINVHEERCDDGNATSGDGCSATCEIDGICGDIDEDGRVTANDALRVLGYATNVLSYCPARACDINADGVVAATDALGVLQVAVGLYEESSCVRQAIVLFRLADTVQLGVLAFDVSYDEAIGEFVGSGDEVMCESLASAAIMAFHHKPGKDKLRVAFISLGGVSGPADLASCVFIRRVPRTSDDLAIDIVEATTSELQLLSPFPTIVAVEP